MLIIFLGFIKVLVLIFWIIDVLMFFCEWSNNKLGLILNDFSVEIEIWLGLDLYLFDVER